MFRINKASTVNTALKALIGVISALLLFLPFMPAVALATSSHPDAAKVDPGAETISIEKQEDVKRSARGQISVLNTQTNNPYNKQVRLYIDVGAEFATYDGDEISEGYIVKCGAGDIITLPIVKAKPGYTFIGWGQGGIPDEIAWDVFVREVQMTDDISDGDSTSIYALYVNDEGDAYCTCGAYKQHAYSDQVDELKDKYQEYRQMYGNASTKQTVGTYSQAVSLIVILCIGMSFLIPIGVSLRSDRKR